MHTNEEDTVVEFHFEDSVFRSSSLKEVSFDAI